MPYFAFALAFPMWWMIQLQKIATGEWKPQGFDKQS